MVIRPSYPDPARRPGATGPEAASSLPVPEPRERAADGVAHPAAVSRDRAEFSSAADELLAGSPVSAAGEGTLAPERARAILQRIRDGHYDRPEVLDTLARTLQSSLTDPTSEA
jgi:hypothetical protein